MKLLKKGTALLLSAAIVLGLVGSGLLIHTIAETAISWRHASYDDLSRYYEVGSKPDGPGYISSVDGDPGGRSYGQYMFASASNTPYRFAQWCADYSNHGNQVYVRIGEILTNAYENPSPGYGPRFDAAWTEVYQTYDAFGTAQYDYTKATFYTPLVEAVEKNVSGFDIEDYSVALKNVFWSRAVQHGVDGAYSLILRAFDGLENDFANQPESELIQAIYNESGRLVTYNQLLSETKNGSGADTMSGNDANKYGLTGLILRYYYGCSSGVQTSVYRRLRVREPADALVMLMNNRTDHLAEGSYQILLNRDSQKLAVDAKDSKLTLNAKDVEGGIQTFTLTYFEGGYYTLTVKVDDQNLRLAADKNGGITLAAPSVSDTQKWLLERGASGYTLKNAGTETYLSHENDTLKMVAGTETASAAEWYLSAVVAANSDWSLQGVIYPTKDNLLVEGRDEDNNSLSSFPVRGVISCAMSIQSVRIQVVNKATGKTVINVSDNPLGTSYNLMEMDDDVTYSTLPAGNYTFTLTAKAADKTFELITSDFTVGKGSGTPVTPVTPADTYTITFDPNGGKLSTSSNTRVVSLDDVVYGKLPTATKEGYAFAGWFTKPDGGEQIMSGNKIIGADLILYAHYTDTYTYTFLDADGDTYMVGTVAEGEFIPAPTTTPAKAPDSKYTYRFKGWEGYTEGKTVMEAKNMTFKPLYTAIPLSQGSEEFDYWTGLTPGTTASQLGKNVVVYDGDTPVSDNTELATGMTAVINKTSFTLVVKGDLNGDGRLTIIDVVALQSQVVGKTALKGPYKEAADLNDDGNISIVDVVKAARVLVGKDVLS